MNKSLFSFPIRRTCESLILVGLFGGLSACSDPVPEQRVVPPVQTFVVGQPGEQGFRRFPGTIAAANSLEMSFEVPGRIVDFPATQGMNAAKGDLLGRLDDANFVARRDAAQSDFNTAREEATRRLQLFERGVISRSEFDSFQQGYEVAEAAFRQASRALADTRLLAPFDGQVARTIASNFENVAAGQSILVFQNIGGLEVDIQIPESSMTAGGRGITVAEARAMVEAQVEFPSIPGLELPLELLSFSTQASRSARTFRVTFLLDPPEGRNVLPGMTCTVLVRFTAAPNIAGSPEENTFELPLRAVGTTAGESRVWILNAETNTVRPVPVEILRLAGENAIIQSDALAPGDEIVSAGVRFLSDGMEVRPLAVANP